MNTVTPIKLFPSSEALQQWTKTQTAAIPVTIMKTVMKSDMKTANGFKVLANAHIRVTLAKDLGRLDKTIQDLYGNLFRSTWRYIQENSPPLLLTFGMINEQTQNDQAGGKFLGSFVYDAIMTLPAVKEHYSQLTQSSETLQVLPP